MDKLQCLSGLHLVITRPLAQAEPWGQRLQALGAEVSFLPLLDIVPVQTFAQIRAIKSCILDFDRYHKAIFVSQNAVEYGFEWLDNYWPQLPYGIDFFAVGAVTANMLQGRGVRITDLAQSQQGAMTSETLLQSPSLQQVKDEKILIFRGCGGLPHLGEVLQSRGASVDYCELYERQLPTNAVKDLTQMLDVGVLHHVIKNQLMNTLVMTLHSGEALTNLVTTLSKIVHDETLLRQNLILLVPSLRVAEQARSAGFNRIYSAENATESSMLQQLMGIV